MCYLTRAIRSLRNKQNLVRNETVAETLWSTILKCKELHSVIIEIWLSWIASSRTRPYTRVSNGPCWIGHVWNYSAWHGTHLSWCIHGSETLLMSWYSLYAFINCCLRQIDKTRWSGRIFNKYMWRRLYKSASKMFGHILRKGSSSFDDHALDWNLVGENSGNTKLKKQTWREIKLWGWFMRNHHGSPRNYIQSLPKWDGDK